MALRVVEYESLAACDARRWSVLLEQCQEATIFQSREWIQAWWQAFQMPDWRIRLFAVYDADDLVGVAPLYERQDIQSPRRRSLHMLGEEHSDYSGFVARTGDGDVVAALLQGVIESLQRQTSIRIDEVPAASTLQRVLERRCRANPLQWVRTGLTPCPWIPIRGSEDSARALLRKSSLRRHRAGLSRLGALEVRHERDAAVIRPHLSQFFHQHMLRWSRTSYPSLFERESNREFYRRLVEALCPTEQVIFSILTLDQRPIAFHLGFLCNSKLLWYKPTFDVTLARYAPGEVLLGALIEYALNHMLEAIDFTRGDEPFKRRFASRTSYNVSYARLSSRRDAIAHHSRAAVRILLNQVNALRSLSRARR